MRFATVRRRAPTRARPGLIAVAVLAAAVQPAIAAADTARIVPDGLARDGGPVRASIVITAVDGAVSTLGPFTAAFEPQALTRSPDGRWFAVPTGFRGIVLGLTIVPADGGAPFDIRLGSTAPKATVATTSQISWSSDSEELIVGYASHASGGAGLAVLRCRVASRECTVVPGVSGMATAVPGGIVSATGYGELVPSIVPRSDTDDRLRPSQLRDVRRKRTARIALSSDAATTTVTERRASAVDGLHGAVRMLGGPSGALVVQQHYRARLVRKRGGLIARERNHAQRWTIVAPDGRHRTFAAPRRTVPRAHSAVAGRERRIRSQRRTVLPAVPQAGGGWLGTVGYPAEVGGGEGLVIARISASGNVTLARTAGKLASATTLVRRLDPAASPGTASLSVLGHEALDDAAIVLLEWVAKRSHLSVVRVPLGGRAAPTVIRSNITRMAEIEQAAW